MAPQAIIFDAEGVVVDSESIWDHGQRVFLERRGCRYDRDRIKPLLTGRSVAEGVAIMQEAYGFGGDVETLAEERIAIVRGLLADEVHFIPGFEAFFRRVRAQYKTCIATAMSEELFQLVDRRLGLSALFGGRIFTLSNVGGRSKPAPDLFLHAARRLGAEPGGCIVIEDAPHGIEAARRAGMRCIGLATTYGRERLEAADFVAERFEAITDDVLKRIASV